MAYCEGCRNDSGPAAGLVMPMEMFRIDPAGLLELMYRGRATLTDPDWKGVLPPDRDPVVARHRRAQGEWRSGTLGWPAGRPTGAATAANYPTLPNYLARTHEGADACDVGGNLMSDAARAYALDRIRQVKALGGVVERDRLYRNLLSSQPIAGPA